jgi:hypothetical protein
MTLELVETSLLQTDLEVDDMVSWCGAHSGPFSGNWMALFQSKRASDSKRRRTCKHSKNSCEPNWGQHLEWCWGRRKRTGFERRVEALLTHRIDEIWAHNVQCGGTSINYPHCCTAWYSWAAMKWSIGFDVNQEIPTWELKQHACLPLGSGQSLKCLSITIDKL